MSRSPFVLRLVAITVTPRLLGSVSQSWLVVRGVQIPRIAVRGIAGSHRLLPRHVDLGPRVPRLHRGIPPSGRGLLVAEADLARSVPDLDLGVLLALDRRPGSRRPLRRVIQHPWSRSSGLPLRRLLTWCLSFVAPVHIGSSIVLEKVLFAFPFGNVPCILGTGKAQGRAALVAKRF